VVNKSIMIVLGPEVPGTIKRRNRARRIHLWARITRERVFPGGVFPAVQLESLRLYDGGLVTNVPMRQALAMGARSLVVHDCNFPGHVPDPPETIAEVLFFTALVTMRSQAVFEAPLVAADVPVVYLHGPEPHRVSPLDFRRTDVLIEAAYEAARSFLNELHVTGPGLYGSP
jgi:NTE family protein